MDFGAFFKTKRINLGLTLRSFCRQHNLDAGNISKLERGRSAAPRNTKIVQRYADYLMLDTTDRQTFMDLAAISAGQIPEDLTDSEVAKRLPVLFRIARGGTTEDGLRELVELIRHA